MNFDPTSPDYNTRDVPVPPANTIRRFVLFGWGWHDAGGGFNDIINSFNLIEEAADFLISQEHGRVKVEYPDKPFTRPDGTQGLIFDRRDVWFDLIHEFWLADLQVGRWIEGTKANQYTEFLRVAEDGKPIGFFFS